MKVSPTVETTGSRKRLQLAAWNPGAGEGRFSGAEARACAADIRSRSRSSEGPASALASSPTRYRGGGAPVPGSASPETQAVRATFLGLRGVVKACARASRVAFAAPRFGDTVKTGVETVSYTHLTLPTNREV